MCKVMRRAAMMVVSLAVVVASFGLRPMEAKALPVLENWTDVQAVSTALMAYMESAGMTIMVEADNWQTLASTMWETIADAYVSDVGAEAAGAATGAAWLTSLAPEIALIGGGIVVGAAAGVGMFKLLDWIMDKYFPGGAGEGIELYQGVIPNLAVTGYFSAVPAYPRDVTPVDVSGAGFAVAPVVYDISVVGDLLPYAFYSSSGEGLLVVCYNNAGALSMHIWSSASSSSGWSKVGSLGVMDSRFFLSEVYSVGRWCVAVDVVDPNGELRRSVTGLLWSDFVGKVDAPSVQSATASVPSSVSAPTIPTGSVMRIETGASSSATPEETLQHVGDQIINNTFSPTYTIVIDPSQDPANPPSGEDSGILDWIKSIYYRLTQLGTGLAESVSEAIQTALLPSEEFIQELPDRVKTTFADRTGFLTYPISVLVDFVGELGKYAEEDFIISWPDVAEPINGFTIMEAGSFNMSAMVRDNESFQTIHDLWFLVAKGMMIIAFLRLCVRKFNSVVGDRMVD